MLQNAGFYREVVESSTVAVVVVGADALIRHHTPAAALMLAGSAADLVGTLFPALFAPESQDRVDAFLRRVTAGETTPATTVEAMSRLGEGDARSIEMTAVSLLASPDVEGVVVHLVDRSDLRRALDLAQRQARFDPLTGLINRRVLEEQGQALYSGAGHTAFVALFDIDHLKAVNDAFGHQAGDQVLRCVADRLSNALGETGIVGRIGGNQFAVLLSEVTAKDARRLLDAACRAIRMPLEDYDLRVTATVGVAASTMAGHWAGLFHRADAALDEAKSRKRGGIFFYRGDEPGWDQRRRQERDALTAARKTVVAMQSDLVRLERETRHDRRTGLLNAAAFEEDLRSLHAVAAERGETYSIVLCDIDFFHQYNTRYLYQPANVTLRLVADSINGACRPGDAVYRYGGEEVVITLLRTSVREATDVAERVRCAVAALALPHEARPQPRIVTISVGVAQCDTQAGGTASSVVDAANRALIVAKQSGRNRVESER